ncbi:hypothetical protein LJC59_02290 [Desulfovibrio sp. OttesenSCG-928-A18]|nr:hypothetical protein [Desulfovibrio sp. OttesenSCG-928-A18]
MIMTSMEWDIKVPIFKHPIIRKQLLLAIGLPFGILFLFLLYLALLGNDDSAVYALGFVSFFFLLCAIIVPLVLPSYDLHLALGADGVLCENQPKQAKRLKRMRTLALILSLISKQPSAAGAAHLGTSRLRVFIPWKRIKKVAYRAKDSYIAISAGWTNTICLFCTPDNYEQVARLVRENTQPEAKVTGLEASS